MTDPQSHDWKSFEKKLNRGYSLDDAAKLCGIPVNKAFEYAKDNVIRPAAASLELKKMAEYSIRVALNHLSKVVKAGPRFDESNSQFGTVTKTHHTDVDAAKALLKLGTDALRICLPKSTDGSPMASAGSQEGAQDMFDFQGE